jgi:hypothetical protein
MTNINKLPQLSNNFDYLIDNDDYNTLHDNPSDYLIVYEYSHPIIDITTELITNHIEFSFHIDKLSDYSYLLINTNQLTNIE